MAKTSATNAQPLHQIISEKLQKQISSGKYAFGERLPSERQLMEQFGVSRITIRRAIANLANQGLVISVRGKGVFVKEQRKVIYSLSNPLVFFEQDMAQQGVTSSIHNLIFKQLSAPEDVRQILQLPEDKTEVYFQKKLLLLDSVPVAVDITYILADLGKTFSQILKSHLTFPTLEQNGIAIARIEATLESTHADGELSEYLKVPLGNPILVYRYVAYTNFQQPIVCGQTLSRGDRLCYSVVLTK